MKIGIAKVIRRLSEKTEAGKKANMLEIESAKDWCKRCIKLRLDQDKLNGNLNKIEYKVRETFDIFHYQMIPLTYTVEATLEIDEIQQPNLFPVESTMGREEVPPKSPRSNTIANERAL